VAGDVNVTGKFIANNFIPIVSTYNGTSATPDTNYSVFFSTAMGGTLTVNNPNGPVALGQKIIIYIIDDGTARSLIFDTKYRAGAIALPTITTVNKAMYLGFIYNSYVDKWDLLGYVDGF
jgi:hypothetical protein